MFVPANESALKEMRPIFDADTARVIGQVDGAEPDTLNVESSRPLLTSYGDQGGEVRRLADQVAKGDELTTQIASPSEGQTLLTETFSLDGSSQALNRLSCYP